MIKIIKEYADGKKVICLQNDYLAVRVTNYGCTILSIITDDKEGNKRDVVLGYDDINDYSRYDGYLGALVGRVANRIGGAAFTLNDKTYHLAKNDGPNCLHGGIKGFSYQLFETRIIDDQLLFHYLSKDGEENFPGNLSLDVIYLLEDNKLIVEYKAFTDQDTLINITNHSYFNLEGKPCNIDDHELRVKADQFACSDENGLVTGELRNVVDTPFDFREEKPIRSEIYKNYDQLIIGKGYDHPFIFNSDKEQVQLYSPRSGIELTVSTTLPLAQIYTANYLDGRKGKQGVSMDRRDAIAIETQFMPDDIHLSKEPKTILRKGDVYDERTSYTFKVK